MFLYQPLYPVDLVAAKPIAPLYPDRNKPELGRTVVALDVYVRRLISVTCIKEKPVWASP
jgi:hypothetical protein